MHFKTKNKDIIKSNVLEDFFFFNFKIQDHILCTKLFRGNWNKQWSILPSGLWLSEVVIAVVR